MFRNLHHWAAGLAIGGAILAGQETIALAAPPYVRQHVAGKIPTPRTLPAPAVAPTPAPTSEDSTLPRVELIQERYPDGKIHKTRYVTLDSERNYVNHGPFIEYTQGGKKIAAGDFNLGLYEGTWTRWHAPQEGPLFDTAIHKLYQQPFTSEVQLHEGKLHGTWTVYDARKQKVSVWNFKHGKRDGKSTWFYPNGHRAREVDYRDGLIDGKSLAFSTTDQPTEDITFIRGRRLLNTPYWHSKGVKAAEGQTLFAMEPIESKYDWWTAEITHVNAPDAGVNEKTGVWIWWHANGQKASEGKFSENLPEGKWTFWHPNGQKHTEGDYLHGKRVGAWVKWAEDGSFVSEDTPDSSSVVEGEPTPADPAKAFGPEFDDDEEGQKFESGRLRIPNLR